MSDDQGGPSTGASPGAAYEERAAVDLGPQANALISNAFLNAVAPAIPDQLTLILTAYRTVARVDGVTANGFSSERVSEIRRLFGPAPEVVPRPAAPVAMAGGSAQGFWGP